MPIDRLEVRVCKFELYFARLKGLAIGAWPKNDGTTIVTECASNRSIGVLEFWLFRNAPLRSNGPKSGSIALARQKTVE